MLRITNIIIIIKNNEFEKDVTEDDGFALINRSRDACGSHLTSLLKIIISPDKHRNRKN